MHFSMWALPLDVPIPAVGCPHFMHQRWGGFTLALAGDGLDLVGVHNMWNYIPKHRDAKITVSQSMLGLYNTWKTWRATADQRRAQDHGLGKRVGPGLWGTAWHARCSVHARSVFKLANTVKNICPSTHFCTSTHPVTHWQGIVCPLWVQLCSVSLS